MRTTAYWDVLNHGVIRRIHYGELIDVPSGDVHELCVRIKSDRPRLAAYRECRFDSVRRSVDHGDFVNARMRHVNQVRAWIGRYKERIVGNGNRFYYDVRRAVDYSDRVSAGAATLLPRAADFHWERPEPARLDHSVGKARSCGGDDIGQLELVWESRPEYRNTLDCLKQLRSRSEN